MNLTKLKEQLEPYLVEHELYLYDLGIVNEAGMQILRVLVDKDSGITIDELTMVNDYLSAILPDDEFATSYYLEVSSPGAERELRNPSEVEKAIGKYVNVKLMNATYEGTLISFDGESLVVRVNLKGRFKNFTINYQDILKIRLAVKF